MRSRPRPVLAVVGALALAASPRPSAAQDEAAPADALAALPIREVSVFKDGHAFVLREGAMPVDAAGNVLVDDLPRPVLGTFWPYAADADARLAGVVAGRRRVSVERTALGVADLLRANAGAEATFRETSVAGVPGREWAGRILGFPERSSEELRRTSAPGTGELAPQQGDVMLAATAEGTVAVPVSRIGSVTFKGECRRTVRTEEFRNLLTLRLDWNGERARTAQVGLAYLQKGLQWIPSYRIDVDGAGRAKVRLQATLVNDLADLERAAVHLVVGVPRFQFDAHADPMAIGAAAAEVFARHPGASRFLRNDLSSNAIQTQVASWGPASDDETATAGTALDPSVLGASAAEDLFVFDLSDVSLRRGERMTVSVAEFEARYSDVYTVDVPAVPPPEVRSRRNEQEQAALRELLRPKALHQIRLENTSAFPVTTAPATIFRDGRVLGQGRTSYTSPRGRCDVAVTTAVGLRVRKAEREAGRKAQAVSWRSNAYQRIDLAGALTVANDTDRAVEVEVTRHVLGLVDSADAGGKVTAIHLAEDDGTSGFAGPDWWRSWDWPWWWRALNGVGRIDWKVRIEPGASVDLPYTFHQFAE